jgi:hypothetical protein
LQNVRQLQLKLQLHSSFAELATYEDVLEVCEALANQHHSAVSGESSTFVIAYVLKILIKLADSTFQLRHRIKAVFCEVLDAPHYGPEPKQLLADVRKIVKQANSVCSKYACALKTLRARYKAKEMRRHLRQSMHPTTGNDSESSEGIAFANLVVYGKQHCIMGISKTALYIFAASVGYELLASCHLSHVQALSLPFFAIKNPSRSVAVTQCSDVIIHTQNQSSLWLSMHHSSMKQRNETVQALCSGYKRCNGRSLYYEEVPAYNIASHDDEPANRTQVTFVSTDLDALLEGCLRAVSTVLSTAGQQFLGFDQIHAAEDAFHEALRHARAGASPRQQALALHHLGCTQIAANRPEAAREVLEQAVFILSRTGQDTFLEAQCLLQAAMAADKMGAGEAATRFLQEAASVDPNLHSQEKLELLVRKSERAQPPCHIAARAIVDAVESCGGSSHELALENQAETESAGSKPMLVSVQIGMAVYRFGCGADCSNVALLSEVVRRHHADCQAMGIEACDVTGLRRIGGTSDLQGEGLVADAASDNQAPVLEAVLDFSPNRAVGAQEMFGAQAEFAQSSLAALRGSAVVRWAVQEELKATLAQSESRLAGAVEAREIVHRALMEAKQLELVSLEARHEAYCGQVLADHEASVQLLMVEHGRQAVLDADSKKTAHALALEAREQQHAEVVRKTGVSAQQAQSLALDSELRQRDAEHAASLASAVRAEKAKHAQELEQLKKRLEAKHDMDLEAARRGREVEFAAQLAASTRAEQAMAELLRQNEQLQELCSRRNRE